jgi:hypothetical protein
MPFNSQLSHQGEEPMSSSMSKSRLLFCSWKTHRLWLLAIAALVATHAAQSLAQPPAVTLTQVGSPIWRPVDFQLFSAPGYEEEDFRSTVDALEPLHPPADATTYTTPHDPPYDAELSTNAAAAGFVNRSVFLREALAGNPNVMFSAFMLVPDPGITGSSRDFASGPVIPSSLFPIAESAETWKDGALNFDHGDGPLHIRPTDQPYDGISHRVRGLSYWNRGGNTLGNWEFRWSLRDAQDNGWDIVAPFQIVAELPELAGDFNQDGAVDAADYVIWRKGLGTTYIQEEYDLWRADFGKTVGSGGALAGPISLPAAPEPAALVIAGIAAVGVGTAVRSTRRAVRRGGLPSPVRQNLGNCQTEYQRNSAT